MPHLGEVQATAARALALALAGGGGGGGGGSTVIVGAAVVTVPAGSFYHEQSVPLTGCTASMRIVASLAPHADTDENSEELLVVDALTASPGTDTATVRIAFAEPTSGPVKINLMAV